MIINITYDIQRDIILSLGIILALFILIGFISNIMIVFIVKKDIEKRYNVNIEFQPWQEVNPFSFLTKYIMMGFFILVMFLQNKNILKWNLFKKAKNTYYDPNPLNKFNYDIKQEKKRNILICAVCFLSFIFTIILFLLIFIGALYSKK